MEEDWGVAKRGQPKTGYKGRGWTETKGWRWGKGVEREGNGVKGAELSERLAAWGLQGAGPGRGAGLEGTAQWGGASRAKGRDGTWSGRRLPASLAPAAHRCSAFYNLPTERSSLRKICHKDVCRCAEGQCAALRTDGSRLSKEELQVAACEAGVDFVYKIKLEGVEASATTPYVYYNMRLQAVIKTGTDPVIPNTMKKFVSHATCHDSLDLQEQESYLVMGQTSDLWKVKSDYTYILGKDTFLMLWPAAGDGDVRRRKLLAELQEFSEYLTTHGCQS